MEITVERTGRSINLLSILISIDNRHNDRTSVLRI